MATLPVSGVLRGFGKKLDRALYWLLTARPHKPYMRIRLTILTVEGPDGGVAQVVRAAES